MVLAIALLTAAGVSSRRYLLPVWPMNVLHLNEFGVDLGYIQEGGNEVVLEIEVPDCTLIEDHFFRGVHTRDPCRCRRRSDLRAAWD